MCQKCVACSSWCHLFCIAALQISWRLLFPVGRDVSQFTCPNADGQEDMWTQLQLPSPLTLCCNTLLGLWLVNRSLKWRQEVLFYFLIKMFLDESWSAYPPKVWWKMCKRVGIRFILTLNIDCKKPNLNLSLLRLWEGGAVDLEWQTMKTWYHPDLKQEVLCYQR